MRRRFRSVLTHFFPFLIDLPRRNKLVSSAMWWNLQNCIALLRYLCVTKTNERGSRKKLLGTPQIRKARLDSEPFMDIYFLRYDRLDLTQFFEISLTPLCLLFFSSISWSWPATLLKERHWHRCFPVNFAKFLRTPFLQNTYGRLLLYIRFSSILSNWKVTFQRNWYFKGCAIWARDFFDINRWYAVGCFILVSWSNEHWLLHCFLRN